MFNIIICEDESSIRNNLKLIINEYIKNNSIPANIKLETDNPNDVIKYVEKNYEKINIYFLDIALNSDTNGLVLAKKIRKYDYNGYLIFITGYPELTLKTFQYKLKALDYICKDDPEIKRRIWECLDVIVNEQQNNNDKENKKTIVIKSGNNIFNIPLDQIVCIETSLNHKVVLYTKNDKIEFYGSLSELQKKLDDNFYRIHRSYIVNLNYIKKISLNKDNLYIIMQNDCKCLLSKKYIREVVRHVRTN